MFIQGLIICLLPALAGAQEHAVLPRGHVFFATDFEGGEALKGWSGPGVLSEGFQGGHALVLKYWKRLFACVTRTVVVNCLPYWRSFRPADTVARFPRMNSSVELND